MSQENKKSDLCTSYEDKPNEFFKNKISESSVSMSLNGRIPPNHLG